MAKTGRGRPRILVPPSPSNTLTLGNGTQSVITEASEKNERKEDTPKQPAVGGSSTMKVTLEEVPTEEAQNPSRKLWVDALTDNRNPNKGMTMEFVAPKRINGEIEVAIEIEDIENEVDVWAPSLIMYVLGGEASMNIVKQYMMRNWNYVKLPDMYYNDAGYFILRFHSYDDRDTVMMKGPYTIRNLPMLLREWKPDFDMKKDMLCTLPIWIKLPQLPLYLWRAKSLSKIGSALGTPIVTGECTANKYRILYARILVEIDITQEPVMVITIRDSEGQKYSTVEYEWKPIFCERCQKVGHKCEKKHVTKKNNG
ncbi:uncharacterized protein LOC131649555 [Vicia villosa]|uniref:uncharacterized protein LOC131649555 n=1 Tax=Vicia villosa TaxID=3911 RepID=UPI00273B01AB|nr:uncharacterized protein LOC131649555 [Vicia villosa]